MDQGVVILIITKSLFFINFQRTKLSLNFLLRVTLGRSYGARSYFEKVSFTMFNTASQTYIRLRYSVNCQLLNHYILQAVLDKHDGIIYYLLRPDLYILLNWMLDFIYCNHVKVSVLIVICVCTGKVLAILTRLHIFSSTKEVISLAVHLCFFAQ